MNTIFVHKIGIKKHVGRIIPSWGQQNKSVPYVEKNNNMALLEKKEKP